MLLLAVGASAAPSGGSLPSKVASLIQSSPTIQRGNVGFQFVDAQTGAVLAELNTAHFFTPASNTKLYTTALALVRLGPNYTFQTQLSTTSAWSPGQTSISDLLLIGGGDPNLSGRVLPYQVRSTQLDPLAAIKELAAKLAARGVRSVDGDVIGVSARYPGDSYPDGWTVDDTSYTYGAPVTALTLNDNAISLTVSPSEVGDLAEIQLQPSTSYFVTLNEVVTQESGKTEIHLERRLGSNELILWGSISKTDAPWREDVAVDNPALFAAFALVGQLHEQGITVRGTAQSRYQEKNTVSQQVPSSTILAAHDSVPLWEDLQVINKVSQNLHAEILLREVAHVSPGLGTLEAGRVEREFFLQQIGITREGSGFVLDDGSGLARQDLTTPQSTVALLRYMWQRPEHDIWLQTLPVGGVDGSLEHRFKGIRGAERVHAKTGSISHVNTLSGYIETERHRWLAFSVMVNATNGPDSQVRQFIDQLCALFLKE